MKPVSISSNNYFRQSAQCLRSSGGSVWRISQRLKKKVLGFLERLGIRDQWFFSTEFSAAYPNSQTDAEVQ